MERTIRIAVANVQFGIGTTRGYLHYLTTAWKYRWPHGSTALPSAARFLREAHVDVAALCEVETGARRTRGLDQVARLAESSGLSSRAFFPTHAVNETIRQGNAVLARHPVRFVANHALPGEGEPRFLSEAEVQVGDVPVRLFATHLSLHQPVRTPQVHRIADLLGPCDTPTVLAGDFNVAKEAELDLLSESILQKAASAPTFPSWRPTRRLDYLFFSRHFRIERAFAFDRFRFSDHLPFVAEVTLLA